MIPAAHHLSLRLLQRCPSCQKKLESHMIEIIRETDTTIYAHIACEHCGSKYLTYIVSNPQGIVGNAMPIDLTYEELQAVFSRQSLTADEVLAIYTLLAKKHLIPLISSSNSMNRKEQTYE